MTNTSEAARNVRDMSSNEMQVALHQAAWDDEHKTAMRAELRSRGATPDERPYSTRSELRLTYNTPRVYAQDISNESGE